MVEPRSHLIRAGHGRVRVLRLMVDGAQFWPLVYTVRRGASMCAVCGCTNRYSCAGGCQWTDSTRRRCSRCLKRSLLP